MKKFLEFIGFLVVFMALFVAYSIACKWSSFESVVLGMLAIQLTALIWERL